jgi:hypothetical protein
MLSFFDILEESREELLSGVYACGVGSIEQCFDPAECCRNWYVPGPDTAPEGAGH